MQDIAHIIESLLFVADEPLSLDKLKSILETVESKDIKTHSLTGPIRIERYFKRDEP